MADAPISKQLALYGKSPERRAINNEYYNELRAQNDVEMRSLQAAHLRVVAEGVIQTTRRLDRLSRQQEQSNEHLEGMSWSLDSIAESAQHIVEQLDDIDGTLRQGFKGVHRGLENIGDILAQSLATQRAQLKTLNDIAELARKRVETESLEYVANAKEQLDLGANTPFPTEGKRHWDKALTLFEKVIANEIGSLNWWAWFNIGYLRWKHLGKIAEAEQAFSEAVLHSAKNRDSWHTRSLRHLAEMQALRGNHQQAYANAQRALGILREAETLYNAARYAQRTGRDAEKVALLEECIELDPFAYLRMFSEKDFGYGVD